MPVPADDTLLTTTEATLQMLRPRLSSAQLRDLADAIDNDGRVLIEYHSQSGGRTLRVISDLQLTGQAISAWCELRGDERSFAVTRILSVTPV